MNCNCCGDLMCPETVIRLRRTLFGLRHSRYEGAYCANCKISIVLKAIDPPPTVRTGAVRPISSGSWRSLLAPPKPGSMASNEQTAHCA